MFDEARDGYEINLETIPVVRRIIRMIGEEKAAIRGVANILNREGLPAPNSDRWNTTLARNLVRDDVYKPHS